MKILVTGGAGFIGSHLLERLLATTEAGLLCLDSFTEDYDPARKRANVQAFEAHPRVEVLEEDVCDATAMATLFATHAIDKVVHLAAMGGVRKSVEAPLSYLQTNVVGTAALLEAARLHSVSAFLLVSSSTVYGGGAVPFVEDAPLGPPSSPYGATKRSAELMGETYYRLFGVPVVCLRPFSVYGPRVRPDLAMSIFAHKLQRGEPIPLFGDGSAKRDFTHVSDVCDGIIAALDCPAAHGQAINLGRGAPASVRHLIDLLAHAVGKPASIDALSARPEELDITCASLEKAKALLGYTPKVSLEEGVGEFVAWHALTYGY